MQLLRIYCGSRLCEVQTRRHPRSHPPGTVSDLSSILLCCPWPSITAHLECLTRQWASRLGPCEKSLACFGRITLNIIYSSYKFSFSLFYTVCPNSPFCIQQIKLFLVAIGKKDWFWPHLMGTFSDLQNKTFQSLCHPFLNSYWEVTISQYPVLSF